MLETIAAWVLRTYVGEYVENLNTDQLSIGYGGIELENLTLKKTALKGLELPLEVKSGFIGKLKVEIPFRNPKSQPWIICVDKLYIIAGPNLDVQANYEERERLREVYKQQQLDALEKQWKESRDNPSGSWWSESWWPSLYSSFSTTVVENLQLKITDVCFRYESHSSEPKKSFALGISIGKLSAQSTNESWEPKFLHDDDELKFKAVELHELSIYWDNDVELVGDLLSKDLETAIKRNLNRTEGKIELQNKHQYILEPVNGKARVRRNSKHVPLTSRDGPRFVIEVILERIPLSLSDIQYAGLIHLTESFQRYFIQQKYIKWRPQVPVKESPVKWWKFAIDCHIHSIQERNLRHSKAFIMERVTDIIFYAKVYREHLTNPTTRQETEEVRKMIEKKMTLEELKILRKAVTSKICHDDNNKKAACNERKTVTADATSNSWGSWLTSWAWSGYSQNAGDDVTGIHLPPEIALEKPVTKEEEEFLDELSEISHDDSLFKRDHTFVQLHFRLNCGSFRLKTHSADCRSPAGTSAIAELSFSNVRWKSEIKPKSGTWEFHIALGGMHLKDLSNSNAVFPVLVEPQRKQKKEESSDSVNENVLPFTASESGTQSFSHASLLEVNYEQRSSGDKTLHKFLVAMQPLNVVYSPNLVRKLRNFSPSAKSKYKLRMSAVDTQLQQMALARYEELKNLTKVEFIKAVDDLMSGESRSEGDRWDIQLDVSAPRIIVPENFQSKETSMVIFDLGKISFMNAPAIERQKIEPGRMETNLSSAEDSDEFITPCSTPPDEEDFQRAIPSLDFSNQSEVIEDLKQRFYQKYCLNLSDLQVIVCKVDENWSVHQRKGTSHLHLIDRFSISLEMERRLVFSADPKWPGVTLSGSLPSLMVHIDESKMQVLYRCLQQAQLYERANLSSHSSYDSSSELNFKGKELMEEEADILVTSSSVPWTGPVQNENDFQSLVSPKKEVSSIQNRAKELLIESRLMLTQFKFDEISLSLHSRGRCVAELRFSGVEAEYTKRPYDFTVSFVLHSLLLVDAIQTYGPEYELLIASHPDVQVFSGQQCQSEGKEVSNHDSKALIHVHYQQVDHDCPSLEATAQQSLKIASVQFNSLDIIANQETILELLNVIRHAIPKGPHLSQDEVLKPINEDRSYIKQISVTSDNNSPFYGKQTPNNEKVQIDAVFQRANLILVRGVTGGHNARIGRKVAAITVADLEFSASFNDDHFVKGSLGGLRVMDLTPDAYVHRCIVSVGDCRVLRPAIISEQLDDQKAFSFSYHKPLSHRIESNEIKVNVHMASTYYIHSGQFLAELNLCMGDFKKYATQMAKSLQTAATDMAIGLVKKRRALADDLSFSRLKTHSIVSNDTFEFVMDDLEEEVTLTSAAQTRVAVDACVESPVVVLPKAHNSIELLVANLGRISFKNAHLFEPADQYQEDATENEIDRLFINIKDMSLYSLTLTDAACNCLIRNTKITFDYVDQVNSDLSTILGPSRVHREMHQPVHLLHDTTVNLRIDRCSSRSATDGLALLDNGKEPSLVVSGEISTPFKVALTNKTYHQLLETLNSLPLKYDVIPQTITANKLHLDFPRRGSSSSLVPTQHPADTVSPVKSKSYHGNLDLLGWSHFNYSNEICDPSPLDLSDSFSVINDKEISFKDTTQVTASFKVPQIELVLGGELGGQEHGFVDVILEEFSMSYNNLLGPVSEMIISLGGLIVEDLLHRGDDRFKYLMSSRSSQQASPSVRNNLTTRLSSSCPENSSYISYEELSTSLPSILHYSPGKSYPKAFSPFRPMLATKKFPSQPLLRKGSNVSEKSTGSEEDTTGDIEIDSLVKVKIVNVDPNSKEFYGDYHQVARTLDIAFSSLDVTINLQTWVVVLEFFGLGAPPQQASPSLDKSEDSVMNNIEEVRDETVTVEDVRDESGKRPNNTNLNLSMHSLSLTLNNERYCLAKAQVSQLFCHVALRGPNQDVSGSLGELSLLDMSPNGTLYKERFLTLGNKALEFQFFRFGESDPDLNRDYDMRLDLKMSSVQYVHTQRFMSEFIAFCQHFLQLQEVLGRMRAVSEGNEVFAVIGRAARVSLSVEADTPILILPRSSSSEELVVAYLGQMTIVNSFLPATSPITVASSLTTSRKRHQEDEPPGKTGGKLSRVQSKCADRLLDCINIGLCDMEVFTARRVEDSQGSRASFGHARQGGPLMRETCKLELIVERNLEWAFGREVPDIIVAGALSSVFVTLDLSQFGLIMGMLGENLGEQLEQFQRPSSYLVDPLDQLPQSDDVWTTLSLSLELVNVSIEMIPKFTFGNIPSRSDALPYLARFDLVKSKLVYESFSDGSRTIDLVSHDVLLHDIRSQDSDGYEPQNVFTRVLQTSEKEEESEARKYLQFEVHYLDTRDKTLVTCLFNRSKIILIMDFIMETWNFIARSEESRFTEKQKWNSPVEAKKPLVQLSPTESVVSRSVYTKGMSNAVKPMPAKTFELKVNITDTELIVVEDCSHKDTRAVILKTTAVMAWRPQHPAERPLTCSLQSLEVFSCTLANIEQTALSIIDPVIVLVELNSGPNPHSRSSAGLLEAVQSLPSLEVNFQSTLNVRVSYHDVKLFLQITESVKRQIARVVDVQRTPDRAPSNGLTSVSKYSSQTVNKLVELGFSKSESIAALEKCEGRLNDAALTLSSQPNEVEIFGTVADTKTESNPYIAGFKIHAGTISVCLIDDCGNSDIPLIEVIANGLLLWHDLQHTGDGSAHATLLVDYYNRAVSRWEPCVEPWKFHVHWQRSFSTDRSQSKLLMKVDAPERLDFNLTTALIDMVAITEKNWREDYNKDDYSTDENGTSADGTERAVKKRAPFVPFLLRNRSGCTLWFGTVTTSPSKAVSYAGGTGLRSVSHSTTSVSSWRKVVAGDEVPFSFESKDKLRHKGTHELKVHQVVVQVDGWQQMTPVSVDQVGEYFRHAPSVSENVSPLQSLQAQPIRVVFAVSLEGARKVVTIRSSLMVMNKMTTPISLWAESFADGIGELLPVLNPDDSLPIPLPFVTWSLYLKPELSRDYDYCEEKLEWKEVSKPFTEKGYSGECVNGKTKEVFRFCYSSYRQGFPEDQPVCLADAVNKKIFPHPGHIIKITHHLVLVNLLPVELTFILKEEGTRHRIRPGKSVPLHSIDSKQPFDIGFTFESYTELHFQRISAKYRSDDVILPFTCHDSKGRSLILNLKIEHDVLSAKISVFAQYWLVNKTGLPLVFRREGEPEEAAGQFEEHEKARSLTPLLFSYIDEESSSRCQMRIGNEYYPDSNTNTLPVWSTPFSLELERDHKTLYVKQGRSRPERAYDFGIDVNYGKGQFSCTKVVSIVTRFQLENRSQHCLAFAQRHIVRGQNTHTPEGTLVSPSGAITLFHWARSDLDQLLCVRLESVEHCRWSGGFKIDVEDSFHVNMRSLLLGVCLFIRVEVLLSGATFHVVFTDAHQLPTPFRIDNMSEVDIAFWQENCVDMSLRTPIKPKQSFPYALDELTLEPKLTVSVFDEMMETYHMTSKEDCPMLYYQNPIYIVFSHTFKRGEVTGHQCSHGTPVEVSDSIKDKQLVLDVDDKHTVLINPKIPHRRSQLWRMTPKGLLKHVGSSSPFDPRKRSSGVDKSGYVLDVDLNQRGDHPRLFLNQQDSKRTNTQTWSFEGGKLRCCYLGAILQPLRGLDGLIEGGVPVLGPANVLTYHGPPLWHCVSTQRLRPGSGALSVKVVTDGPTRVLRVNDYRHQSTDEDWMVVEPRRDLLKAAKLSSEDEEQHEIELSISLAGGIGISLVNNVPEEIVFVTLPQIEVEFLGDRKYQTLELTVGNVQIDNQLFGCQLPVVLYPTPSTSKGESSRVDHAIQISIQREKSDSYDLEIFRRFLVSMRRLTVTLEDRTLFKLLQFFGYGNEEEDDFAVDDFNVYDSQRTLESRESNSGKRVYFERLRLGETQFRLSLAAVGRLTPDLQKIKKYIGIPIVSLEDAVIDFGAFKRQHLFETNSSVFQQVGRYYKEALLGQVPNVLGSLDIFGNPMGLLHDVSTGVEGLVKKGNLGGLFINVAHGLSDATAKMTGTVADGLWTASMDTKFQESREAMRADRSGSSSDHFAAGLKGLGMGLFGGLTSIVTQPIEGASRKGLQGFITGFAKGLVGTVAKPTAGILDLASGAAAAVRGSARARPNAPKPVRLKRNCYDAGGVLPKYSKAMAEGQEVLLKLNDGDIDERFISSEVIRSDPVDGLRSVISTEGVYFVKTNKVLSPESVVLRVEYAKLYDSRYLNEDSQHYLELIKCRESNGEVLPSKNPDKRPRVRCESAKIVRKVSQKINYMRSLYEERQFVVLPHQASGS